MTAQTVERPVAARPAAAATAQVAMANQRFNPARIQINLGDYVEGQAQDDEHTVTARDGSFDSSSRGVMVEGDDYRIRFRTPGTFDYFCRVHGNRGMTGQVVVVDPGAPTTASTRLTPVSAAATTSTSAPTTTTTAPTTTTSRVLATSSSTSPAIATTTTAVSGVPVAPQEPPTFNPAAPVVGSPSRAGLEAAAAQRTADSKDGRGAAVLGVGLGLLAVLAGSAAFVPRRRARRSPG
jgi:plastocyanin